jgi:hypothetical protein
LEDVNQTGVDVSGSGTGQVESSREISVETDKDTEFGETRGDLARRLIRKRGATVWITHNFSNSRHAERDDSVCLGVNTSLDRGLDGRAVNGLVKDREVLVHIKGYKTMDEERREVLNMETDGARTW